MNKMRLPNGRGFYFIAQNWKLIVHLLFRTKRFGVNNKRSFGFDSIMGWGVREQVFGILRIKPIIDNYRYARIRAESCGLLSATECKNLGWDYDENILRLEKK